MAAVFALLPAMLGASGPQTSQPEPSPGAEPEAPAIATDPWFVDVAEAAGLTVAHRNRSFENPYAHIMEGYTALGAAVAIADVDNDGFEDLFLTDSSIDGRNRLYLNNGGKSGDLTFEEVGEKAGVAVGNDAENASADALFFDADNDGDQDLLVVRFGQNLLFENRFAQGEGVSFKDVTAGSGLEQYLNNIAAIAFDFDLDGDLDLFYANYFAPVNLFDPETPRFFPESFETAANGGGVTAFRNDSGSEGLRFTDVTEAVGLGNISGWSLDLGHADADHDGDDDLYVAADFGTDSFFRNNVRSSDPSAQGVGFTDISESAIGIDTKKGMNADWADFDRDGLFDLYVTNITDEYMREGNFLWQNQGDLTFTDVARETGTHDTGWGWAGKFFDADNDGLLDLYVVNGWVSGNDDNYVLDVFELIIRDDIDLADARNWPPMGEKTLSGYQRNSLFHNQGGQLFKDVAAEHGMDSILDARGIGLADLDRDGRVDLVITNAGNKPILARNRHGESSGKGDTGADPQSRAHWIRLQLEGTDSNRDAVGARVVVTAGGQERWSFVDGGNGFAGQSSRILHFGLGELDRIEGVRVLWPSGLEEKVGRLAADRLYKWTEGRPPKGGPAPPRSGAASKAGLPQPVVPPEQHFEQAMASLGRGDFETAEDHFQRSIVGAPDRLRWGAEYRQAVIAQDSKKAYGPSLDFWQAMAEAFPGSSSVQLNWGYALVDKIPVEGAITAVILANKALDAFTRALELEPSWLAYYTRGNSYMYWPPIFNRTQLGIDDLEKALALAEQEPHKAVHGYAWTALGDGYWRLDQREKMREVWREGLERYPDTESLRRRLDLEGDALDTFLQTHFETTTRVATDLRDLWAEPEVEEGSTGSSTAVSSETAPGDGDEQQP